MVKSVARATARYPDAGVRSDGVVASLARVALVESELTLVDVCKHKQEDIVVIYPSNICAYLSINSIFVLMYVNSISLSMLTLEKQKDQSIADGYK